MKPRKIDVEITEPNGSIIFSKKDVEVPMHWSDRAATIAASKYFSYDENSVFTVIGRVARQITEWGNIQGYFGQDATPIKIPNEDFHRTLDGRRIASGTEESIKFTNHLKDILLNQRAAFNSPVWFNIGVKENDNQVAACFVYGVEDNMEDILAHVKREGMTFKNGSGAGVNVSNLRARGEVLSNRGVASGPISFMRIWDQTAASIKSGGKTRRSAKMVVMDINHPDIEEFIECKLQEEKKALILMKNGISHEEAYATVAFQNANHSIMVSNDFMNAVRHGDSWPLYNRGDGKVAKVVDAQELFTKIAKIAWATGDPGLQFYDRINQDNPVPTLGNIVCSNPCAEHVAINNSACNLASMNLVAYLSKDGKFNTDQFTKDIDVIITAQDIMIDKADYPTPETKKIAMETRPLGLGFTNLGAYLMLKGLPYDSEEARLEASKISALMTETAYETSIKLAKQVGPYKHFRDNEDRNCQLITNLTNSTLLYEDAKKYGIRNSQLTLLAPTGTISFLMDCDTTGIEPLYALKSTKTLAGGGTIEMIPDCVEAAVNNLLETEALVWNGEYAVELIIPSLSKEKQAIFKTANDISPHDHILMMAACQRHLNGAISKTVNVSAEATVEDIADIYMTAWKQGLKSIAIYRDGSKQFQPLVAHTDNNDIAFDEQEDTEPKWTAIRRKLPKTRQSITHKFDIAGLEGYLTSSTYDEGELGEIFIRTQKQGTTIQGLMDGFATAVSLGLQYGVPLETFADKFIGSKFEPAGFTRDEDIPSATSITDYIFKWLKMQFMDEEEDESFVHESIAPGTNIRRAKIAFDGPPCPKCQTITGQNGSCYVCPQCGETTGCS